MLEVQASFISTFSAQLLLGGVHVGPPLAVAAACPPYLVQLASGSCGCAAGSAPSLSGGACAVCPQKTSSAAGESECSVCESQCAAFATRVRVMVRVRVRDGESECSVCESECAALATRVRVRVRVRVTTTLP